MRTERHFSTTVKKQKYSTSGTSPWPNFEGDFYRIRSKRWWLYGIKLNGERWLQKNMANTQDRHQLNRWPLAWLGQGCKLSWFGHAFQLGILPKAILHGMAEVVITEEDHVNRGRTTSRNIQASPCRRCCSLQMTEAAITSKASVRVHQWRLIVTRMQHLFIWQCWSDFMTDSFLSFIKIVIKMFSLQWVCIDCDREGMPSLLSWNSLVSMFDVSSTRCCCHFMCRSGFGSLNFAFLVDHTTNALCYAANQSLSKLL